MLQVWTVLYACGIAVNGNAHIFSNSAGLCCVKTYNTLKTVYCSVIWHVAENTTWSHCPHHGMSGGCRQTYAGIEGMAGVSIMSPWLLVSGLWKNFTIPARNTQWEDIAILLRVMSNISSPSMRAHRSLPFTIPFDFTKRCMNSNHTATIDKHNQYICPKAMTALLCLLQRIHTWTWATKPHAQAQPTHNVKKLHRHANMATRLSQVLFECTLVEETISHVFSECCSSGLDSIGKLLHGLHHAPQSCEHREAMAGTPLPPLSPATDHLRESLNCYEIKGLE